MAVPRAELPATRENEYYWGDLVGSQAANREGEPLGEVTGLIETGSNPVLVLKGERERLVPFIADVVAEVDLARRRLVLDWDKDF